MPDPRRPETTSGLPDPGNPGDAPADPLATAKLAFAWLFVGLPAAWGIWQVFVKSLALFR
jgi:hypothetical protein